MKQTLAKRMKMYSTIMTNYILIVKIHMEQMKAWQLFKMIVYLKVILILNLKIKKILLKLKAEEKQINPINLEELTAKKLIFKS
jgi:hypothetical protein